MKNDDQSNITVITSTDYGYIENGKYIFTKGIKKVIIS